MYLSMYLYLLCGEMCLPCNFLVAAMAMCALVVSAGANSQTQSAASCSEYFVISPARNTILLAFGCASPEVSNGVCKIIKWINLHSHTHTHKHKRAQIALQNRRELCWWACVKIVSNMLGRKFAHRNLLASCFIYLQIEVAQQKLMGKHSLPASLLLLSLLLDILLDVWPVYLCVCVCV